MSAPLRASAGVRSSDGLRSLTGAGFATATTVKIKNIAVAIKPFIGQPPCYV
jgi:hypothetical protein